MTLDQIHNLYPKHRFHAYTMGKKYRAFRLRVFGPKVEALIGNKIIYMEARILCVAKVEDLQVSEGGFSALVVPTLDSATGDNPQKRPRAPLLWSFSTRWGMLCSTRQFFYVHYAGWRFWPDSEYVVPIENLLLEKGQQAAAAYIHKLSWNDG